MSLPLIDQRIKITPEAASLLEAVHVSTGKDKSEIARDVLHKWAVVEIKAAMVLCDELEVKGILRDHQRQSGLYRSTVEGRA